MTGGRLVVVEDHYPEGGLGAAVLEALADAGVPPFQRRPPRRVRGLPGSGTPAELLDAAGISAPHIAGAARRLVAAMTPPQTPRRTSMKPTQHLHEAGQSLWLDTITRGLLDTGTLATYIGEYSITGLTEGGAP